MSMARIGKSFIRVLFSFSIIASIIFTGIPSIVVLGTDTEPEIGTQINVAEETSVTLSGSEYPAYNTERIIEFDNGGAACNIPAHFENLSFGGSNSYNFTANVLVTNDATNYGSIRLIVASGVTKKSGDGRTKAVELCVRPSKGRALLFLSASGAGEETLSSANSPQALEDGSYKYTVSYNNGLVSFWVNGTLMFDRFDLTPYATDLTPDAGAFSQNCSGMISNIQIFGDVSAIKKNTIDEKSDSNVFPSVTATRLVDDAKADTSASLLANTKSGTERYIFSGLICQNNEYNLSANAVFYDNTNVYNETYEYNWEGLIFNIAQATKDDESYRIEIRVRSTRVILFAVNKTTNKETVIATFNLKTSYGENAGYTVSYHSDGKVDFWKNDTVIIKGLDIAGYGYTNVSPLIGLGGEVCAYQFDQIKLWGENIEITGIIPAKPDGNGNYADVMEIKESSATVTYQDGTIKSSDDSVTYKSDYQYVPFTAPDSFVYSADVNVTSADKNWKGVRFLLGKDTDEKRYAVYMTGNSILVMRDDTQLASAKYTRQFDTTYRIDMHCTKEWVTVWLNGNLMIERCKTPEKSDGVIGIWFEYAQAKVSNINLYYTDPVEFVIPEKPVKITKNVFNGTNIFPSITVTRITDDSKADTSGSLLANAKAGTERYIFSGLICQKNEYNLSANAVFYDNTAVYKENNEYNWEGLIFNLAQASKDDENYRIELRVRSARAILFAVNKATNKETVVDTFSLTTKYGETNEYTVFYRSDDTVDFWKNDTVVLKMLDISSYGYTNISPLIGLGGEVCKYRFDQIKLWGENIEITGVIPSKPEGNGNYADVMTLKELSSTVLYKDGIIKSSDAVVTYKSDYKYVPFTASDSFVYGADVKVDSADKNWKGVRFLFGRDSNEKRYAVYMTGNSILVMRGDTQLAYAKYTRELGTTYRIDMYCTPEQITVWLNGNLMIERCKTPEKKNGTVGIWFEYTKAQVSNINLYYTNPMEFVVPQIPKLKTMKAGQYNAAKYMNVTLNNQPYNGYFGCRIVENDSKVGNTYRFTNLPIADNMSYYYRALVTVNESTANWKGPRLIYRTSGSKTFYLVFTQNSMLLLADSQTIATYKHKLELKKTYDTVIYSTPDSVSVWLDGVLIFENVSLSSYASSIPLTAAPGVKFELCRASLTNIQIYGDDVVIDMSLIDEELYNDYYYYLETIPQRPSGNANLFENVYMHDMSDGALGAEYDSESRYLFSKYNDCSGKVAFYDAKNSSNLNGLKNSSVYVLQFTYNAKSSGVKNLGESGFWFTLRSSSVPGNTDENTLKFGFGGDALMIKSFQRGKTNSSQIISFNRAFNRDYRVSLVCGKTWLKVYVDGELLMIANQLPFYNVNFSITISNTQSVFKDFLLYNAEPDSTQVLEKRVTNSVSRAGNTLLVSNDVVLPASVDVPIVRIVLFSALGITSLFALILVILKRKKRIKE